MHNAESDESPNQTGQNSPLPPKDSEDKATPEPPASPGETEDVKKAKKAATEAAIKKRKINKLEKDLTICHTIVSEMEALEDAWPFLFPVNTKQFPTYKKIIKVPMDIATIKKKLDSNGYKLREEFVDDVRLIFTNCELFNEDDSPVGKAGHTMLSHFETRWVDLISL